MPRTASRIGRTCASCVRTSLCVCVCVWCVCVCVLIYIYIYTHTGKATNLHPYNPTAGEEEWGGGEGHGKRVYGRCVIHTHSWLQCVAVCCSVLQCAVRR